MSFTQSGYYNVIVSNQSGQISSAKALVSVGEAIMSTNIYAPLYTNQLALLQFSNLIDITCSGSYRAICALKADGTVVTFGQDNPPSIGNLVALSSVVTGLEANGLAVQWEPFGNQGVAPLAVNIAAMSGFGSQLLLNSNAMLAWSGNPNNILPGLSNIAGIAGVGAGAALRADGTVALLGGGNSPEGLTNAIAISYGYGPLLALLANGTVVAWDGEDQLSSPFPTSSNIVAITAASDGAIALTADGQLLSSGSYPYAPEFPCVLTNVFHVAVDPATASLAIALVGNGAPFVTVQPGNQFVPQGATVWLHARAVGVQPMTYQWARDGINIDGATNADLTITNLVSSRYGNYQAVISNRVASTSTRAATVSSPIPFPPSVTTPGGGYYSLSYALGTNLPWRSTSQLGSASWFGEGIVLYDGLPAAQSGAISNSQQSILQTTVKGPGTLSFWWMVSSEEDFDFLQFWINNTNVAEISGEGSWEQATFSIGAGSNTLEWIYSKDPDVSVGLDAGWLAQVVFTPTVPVTLGVPQILPAGELIFPTVSASGGTSSLNATTDIYFEASSDLIEWTPLTNSLILSNGLVSVSDPDATNSAARFYRLQRQ